MGIAEQEVDGDGNGPLCLGHAATNDRGDARELGVRERDQDTPVFGYALVYPDAVPALGEGGGFDPGEVVVVSAVYALDEGDVFEPLRGQVEHPRARPLVEGVDGYGCPEDEVGDAFRAYSRGLQRVEYALMGDSRRRWPLGDQYLVAILVDGHQIGEGASGVYTHAHDMTA